MLNSALPGTHSPGPRHWPLPRQCLLAIGLALLALVLRERMRPLLGKRMPFLPVFAMLLILVLLVRPAPFLLRAAVGGGGVVWRPQTAAPAGDLLLFAGAALLAGVAAWLSARGRDRQHRLAREAAEQREKLRVTLASIADAVITTDGAGRVEDMNPVASRMTGWSAQAARGRPLAQVLRIVDAASRAPAHDPVAAWPGSAAAAAAPAAVAAAGEASAPPLLLIARDGGEHPIESSVALIHAADGRTQGALRVFRDVGERREAEAARRLAARRKDEFLATLAHELRNPLGPAVNALQILGQAKAGAARTRVRAACSNASCGTWCG